MAAYVIAQIGVKDSKLFAEYREKVVATIERYGGRYRARSGDVGVAGGNAARIARCHHRVRRHGRCLALVRVRGV